MKNLKIAFLGLVLGCVSFAGAMAAVNGGHVARPDYVVTIPEITIVGDLPVTETIPVTITAGAPGKIETRKVAARSTVSRVQVRVTDLEQGGAPGAESVTRFN